MARLNQTAIESQNTQGYANMLTTAQPPVEPASPKVVLNTLMSIFVGTLLAVATAMLLELKNRRIRAADDVVASLGLPVLGVLPKPDAKRFSSGKKNLLLQQRVIGLPAPTRGA
jgi:capsular polysaccharide biosynthesis protein